WPTTASVCQIDPMEKQAYFTSANLHCKSLRLLAGVDAFRRRHAAIRVCPQQAALLVLDMQNSFLSPHSHAFVPSAPAILDVIRRLQTLFMVAGRPVIFTKHANSPANAGMMSVWWRELILPDTASSQIVSTLDTGNCLVIEKSQYDAFWKTDLDFTLRSMGVAQVVITGVMTHLCCETTARSAFVQGYNVFLAVDGTATYTEALHRASLLTLSHGYAMPLLADEIAGAFRD
ncbi:MAG: isochorismatase family protein, partial [Verrucomicrobiia bacterium]